MSNPVCNERFVHCMNTYDDDNYDAVYATCWGAGESFGANAMDMIEVFSAPPNFDDYAPESDETAAVA